jgi:hypothetical protein
VPPVPIRVRLPVKVRLDAAAGKDAVAPTVASVTARALANAQQEVGVGVEQGTLHSPDIRWSGDASALAPNVRADIEKDIRSALIDAAGRAASQRTQSHAQPVRVSGVERKVAKKAPIRWRRLAARSFPMKIGDFLNLLQDFGGEDLGPVYADYLETIQPVRASVYEVLRDEFTHPLGEELGGRELKQIVKPGQFGRYGYSTMESDRAKLLRLDREGKLARLPDLAINGWRAVPTIYGPALRSHGRLLVLAAVLPVVEIRDYAWLHDVLEERLPLRDVSDRVDPESFERLFGVPLTNYLEEFGHERVPVRLLPFSMLRPARSETLRFFLDEVVASSLDPTTVYFGRLELLNSTTIASLPPEFRSFAQDFADPLTLSLTDERRFGGWEAHWSGALVYVVVDLDPTRAELALLRPDARDAADELARAIAEGERHRRRVALYNFLHRRYERSPRPKAFEFLLAELEERGQFDSIFDAFDYFENEKPVLDLVWQTKYKDHPRVRRSADRWNARLRTYRRHRYWPERDEIWVDEDPGTTLRKGGVIADVGYDAYQVLMEPRLRPERRAEFERALGEVAPVFMGQLMSGDNPAEYESWEAVFAVIAKQAADKVELSEADVEQVEIGRRSARLLAVDERYEGAELRYYVTYELVDQAVGSDKWVAVEGSKRTVSEWDFQELIRAWRYTHWAEFVITVAKWEMAIVMLILAPAAFPELLAAAGGAKLVLASVALSEAIMVFTHVYRGEKIEVEDFVIAAVEGYVFALGFHGASLLGKAIFGDVGKIATAALRANLQRWIVAKVFVGSVGGSTTTAANLFVRDLIEVSILRKRGRYHTPAEYAQHMAVGTVIGVGIELAGPLLKPLLGRVGRAFGAALEGGAAALQTVRGVARFFRIRGVTYEAFAEIAEVAAKELDKHLESVLSPAVRKEIVEAFTLRFRQVVDELKQLPGEMAGVIAEDLLELAGIQLSRGARSGLDALLAPGSRLEAEAVHDLVQRLAREPRRLSALLETVGSLERGAFASAKLGAADLEALASASRMQSVLRRAGGAGDFALLRDVFRGSINDAERFLARISRQPPPVQERVLATLLRPGRVVAPDALALAVERTGWLSEEMLAGLDRLYASGSARPLAAELIGRTPQASLKPFLETCGRLSVEDIEILASGGYLEALGRSPRTLSWIERPENMSVLRDHLRPGGTASRLGVEPSRFVQLLEGVLRRTPGISPKRIESAFESLAALSETPAAPIGPRRAWEPHPAEEGLPPAEVSAPEEQLAGTLDDVERALYGEDPPPEALDELGSLLDDPTYRERRPSVQQQERAERLRYTERFVESPAVRAQAQAAADTLGERYGWEQAGWQWWIERVPRYGSFEAQLQAFAPIDPIFARSGYGLVLRSPLQTVRRGRPVSPVYKPDAVVQWPRGGFAFGEYKAPLGPQSQSFYNSPEGRQSLFEVMFERVEMSRELPGCSGWIYDTGEQWLDDIILEIVETRFGREAAGRILVPKAKGAGRLP